ncbi:AraC family transcriptional regulator [Hymenobacter gummosus]|uniref:AraC family transcriptional regulator n=1 Tax=Hymenobacter gummosus TaxID=1776032 RepID=A0A3S0H571_9BACT|nr:helix-turn-helix transcriptional regulator [Hymenobacter gummosus]RTQ45116.1 AraC family transcriptional regulator [Hymenobacter gummosus]
MTEPNDDDQAMLRNFRQLAARAVPDPTFTVARAADLLDMSERSLYRRFRELTGQTPYAYLREHRLHHARQLLQEGAVRSVEEAAFAVGIEDVAYFARIFYRHFRQRASDLLHP